MCNITAKFVAILLFGYLNRTSAQALNSLQEIITKDDDVHKYLHYLWCPSKLLGVMCPENSLTYYYYCCGDLRNKCCYAKRTWITCASLAVPGFILVFIGVYLFQKFICTKTNLYVAGKRRLERS